MGGNDSTVASKAASCYLLPASLPNQKAVTVISDLADLPLSNVYAGDADAQLGLL